MLLVGANTVQIVSAMYKEGFKVIGTITENLKS